MAQLASYKAKVPPSTDNRLAGRYVTQREREKRERYSVCCTWTCTMKLALGTEIEEDEERVREPVRETERERKREVEERSKGIANDCGNRRKEKEKE